MRYSHDSRHDSWAGSHDTAQKEDEGEDQEDSEFDEPPNRDYPPCHQPLLPLTHHDKDYESDTGVVERDPWRGKGRGREKGKFRQHRLKVEGNGLLQLATLFLLCVVTLLGLGTCGWVGWFMYTRHNAYAQSVFSPSLQPNPQTLEPLVPPFGSNLPTNPSLFDAQSQLDERLLSLSLPPSTLSSPALSAPSHFDSNTTLATRYSSLPSSGPYLFALNLYNSQTVIPTLAQTLLSVSD